ncbi:MAG TPA: asparagine synthase (glutamine-hydrolyzing) [Candidatus Acidoferrum sp.]|nr:asparagine synthase (glutamine-hydrolyzing) [Candidatus Acidoferrum sp.]
MCGIAGIVSLDGFDPKTLVAMTDLVSYRGPSGFGFAFSQPGKNSRIEIIHDERRMPTISLPVVGLGSRRLAILDLSPAGNQPMMSDNGDLCITFNGEIYNYKEIHHELENYGHKFRTGTDTEVILRAYREWGQECLARFNGMWGFAIWDRARQRLFCARDRFGVKPFYYAMVAGRFYFASEIKQILQASSVSRVANAQSVYAFLEWGLLDGSSDTFFTGVHQLPGGHALTLDLTVPLAPSVHRYWELRVQPTGEITPQEAVEEFRRRFKAAVKLRMRSDVPIGVSLSGGLDSSSVLCQAKEIEPSVEIKGFSACFEDRPIDERDYISIVLASVGSSGHMTYPRSNAFWKNIKSIVYHMDEPLMSTGVFPQWCVMEDARNYGTPVLLGGQGGDEALCGYQKYRYFYLWQLLRTCDPRIIRETLLWPRNGTTSYWTLDAASRYLPSIFRSPFSLTARVGTSEFKDNFKKTVSGLGAAQSIAERQKLDLTYSSIPSLLHHEDRISMAHSIESRLPFLDYELVEFAVNCPAHLKLRNGWSKWLLRSALSGTLPEQIRLRKTKLGFDTPDAEWVRVGLQNGHRALWDAPDALRMSRFMNARSLANECRAFLQKDSRALSSSAIFRAISLELWAEVHGVS